MPPPTLPENRINLHGQPPVRVDLSSPPTAQAAGPTARQRSSSRFSQREQLMAAAQSLVWFAGWFQAIYDEIAGQNPQPPPPRR